MSFHGASVWLLLLLPLALLAWWRILSPRRRATIAYSDVRLLRPVRGGIAARLHWLPAALRMLAMALLVICVARPIKADEQVRIQVDGIAIMLVVDRSGSMMATDFRINGRPVDRLTAVKRVVRDFVRGDGGALVGRPDDLVGLVAFARFADTLSPLTLDHDHLIAAVNAIQPANERGEDGTAIGEGIALAVERLRDATDRLGIDDARRIRSKVIILLSDGENNSGDIDPITAAELAAAAGIRVHAIGAGTDGRVTAGLTPGAVRGTGGRGVGFDERGLMQIAEITGGRYFRATDSESLRAVYAEIDAMEKTRSESRRALLFTDFAVEPFSWRGWPIPPLLLPVAALLALELLLTSTRLRRLPA
ncbi:MAG TPA: VWA domain-containing protein [Phycisphaerales bacterium]|nr:VWA domain-containing protein [Phycisphaerales bacterium]HMP38081.1 VWA domain-containing protein [Phycisphaerales bacterium]